jgi:RNA polymerase sigma-70 factor (ECF subfamily)
MATTATVQATEQQTNIVSIEAFSSKNLLTYEEQFLEKTGYIFKDYYSKYFPKLVWNIQGFKITDLDAEEIANEAFMESLIKIDKYNAQWAFSTWLFTIARNLAKQYKKDHGKEILVDLTAENTDEDSNYDPVHSYLKNKMDTAEDTVQLTQDYRLKMKVKYSETMKEISKLDAKYRTIIELSDVKGKSYNEICDILGDELGKTPEQRLQTVKNRLHHGRLRLEKNLREKFAIIEDRF